MPSTSHTSKLSNNIGSKTHQILLAPVRLVSKVCCATSSSFGGSQPQGSKGAKPENSHQKRPRRGSKSNKIGDAETATQQGFESDIALAAAAAAAADEESGSFLGNSDTTADTGQSTSQATLTSSGLALTNSPSSTSSLGTNQKTMMKKKLFSSNKKDFLGRVQTQLLASLQNLNSKKFDSHKKLLIQSFGLFIYECMTTSGRKYHAIPHVFDVLDPNSNDDLLDIATLFHDVVYYTIDGGLSEKQHELLDGLIESQTATSLVLNRKALQQNILLGIITDLFGYEADIPISPMQGSNEFLSAVCAAVLLKEVLNVEQIVQIAACIEATIPFRPTTEEEGGPMDRLHRRLKAVNTKYSLFLSKEECNQAIRRATILAYWDLKNFSFLRPAAFLDNTWALLPETNPTLRGNSYTFSEYQHAILKMHRFFGFLQAPQVFVKFQNTPANYSELERGTARNLSVGKAYIGCKLVASSLLVALADMTSGVGGDSPSNLLVNLNKHKDWTPSQSSSRSSSSTIKQSDNGQQQQHYDEIVYQTLFDGRSKETWFDIPQSYLAAYLYKTLGATRTADLASKYCAENPLNKGQELIQAIPQDTLHLIVQHLVKSDAPRSKSLEVDTKKLWC